MKPHIPPTVATSENHSVFNQSAQIRHRLVETLYSDSVCVTQVLTCHNTLITQALLRMEATGGGSRGLDEGNNFNGIPRRILFFPTEFRVRVLHDETCVASFLIARQRSLCDIDTEPQSIFLSIKNMKPTRKPSSVATTQTKSARVRKPSLKFTVGSGKTAAVICGYCGTVHATPGENCPE